MIVPHSESASGQMMLIAGRSVTKYEVSAELKSAAIATAKSAAELLRDHCPAAAPTYKVKVLDYTSAELRQQAVAHYDIPESERNNSFYDKMYINTMALDQVFEAKNQY